MFGFISAFFQKTAALVASVLIAVGLVSAPTSMPAPIESPNPAVQKEATAIVAEQVSKPEVPKPVKPEIKEPAKKIVSKKVAPVPAPVSTVPVVVPTKTQKLILPSGAIVEIDANGNIIQSGSVGESAPAPAPSPTPTAAPVPAPLPPGFFRTPSGSIVDENGNIVKQ